MVGNPVHYNEKWTLTNSGRKELDHAQYLRNKDKSEANIWVFLSGTTTGRIGWARGYVCTDGVNINHVKKHDLLQASYIVAHETGHNLGMDHDFTYQGNDQKTRFFNGESCIDKGIESYGRPPLKWSKCSRNDFLAYFNEFGKSKWCLQCKSNVIT